MGGQICIVIPIYKNTLSLLVKQALAHNLNMIGTTPCYFIAPERLNVQYYNKNFGKIPVLRFPDKFFKNTKTYNKLMLLPSFYKCFERYRYICICQTDVLLLRKIDYLIDLAGKGYDYWGAPWYPLHKIRLYKFKSKCMESFWRKHARAYIIKVGNGGLSLRNVKKSLQLLNHHPFMRRIWNQNEDYFFAVLGKYFEPQFEIAPHGEAKKFSLETNMKRIIKENGVIPYGVHAWEKFYPQLLEEVMADEGM